MKSICAYVYCPVDLDFEANTDGLENPFYISMYGIAHGPENQRMEIPAFYKKEGVWCIRFSPSTTGDWTITTLSAYPELSGRQVLVSAAANGNPDQHGMLRIDPQSPRHFSYEDGTPCYLMGYELNWLWSLDQMQPTTERMSHLLDVLKAGGFNHIFVNSYAYDTVWMTGNTNEYDFGPPKLLPWEGPHGNHNYSRLNLAYWEEYDRMMWALWSRGMDAHIYMKVYNKLVEWPERRSREEDLFFDYMVARYQGFPNVVWDFSKEAYYEPDKEYMLDRMAEMKRLDAYGHLMTIHDDLSISLHPSRRVHIDFITEQNHIDLYYTTVHQRTLFNGPIVNEEFAYEQVPGFRSGGTGSWFHTNEEVMKRAYEVVMAGAYMAHYYTYHAWDMIKWDEAPKLLNAFKSLSELFASSDWRRLEPKPEYGDEGTRCLIDSMQTEMIAYTPTGKLWLAAHFLKPCWEGYWMNMMSGEKVLCRIELNQRQIPSPFGNEAAALYLRAVD